MHPILTLMIMSAVLVLGFGASGQTQRPDNLAHPGQVALLESTEGWRYVHFPTNLRLYTNDRDPDNQSVCNAGCSSTWPPVVAPDEAFPIGDWTIFVREDGRRQWAYKGRPVYVLYHDSPSEPGGDGHDGVWHILEP